MAAPLRVGLIGLGRFGSHYARLLQKVEGVSFYAVAARDEKSFTAASVPAETKRYTDGADLIGDPNVDCVIIATPTTTHAALSIAALAADKHVLVEKPMTATLAEARAVATAVEKSGRTFMVGHQYLYNDYIRELKRQMDAGTLGAIAYVFAEHFYPGPVRSDIGCFWETATHEIAMLDYFFGRPAASEIIGTRIDIDKRGHEDYASIAFTLSNGARATIVNSWIAPKKTRRLIIAGDKGAVLFDDLEPHEKLKFTPAPDVNMDRDAGTALSLFRSDTEPLFNEFTHFIHVARTGTPPLTDITHGLYVTEMLNAIYQAVPLREN